MRILRAEPPPDWLFGNRQSFGLFAVLADLGATVRYDVLFGDALG